MKNNLIPNVKKIKKVSNPDDEWLKNWYSNRKIEDDYIQEGLIWINLLYAKNKK